MVDLHSSEDYTSKNRWAAESGFFYKNNTELSGKEVMDLEGIGGTRMSMTKIYCMKFSRN